MWFCWFGLVLNNKILLIMLGFGATLHLSLWTWLWMEMYIYSTQNFRILYLEIQFLSFHMVDNYSWVFYQWICSTLSNICFQQFMWFWSFSNHVFSPFKYSCVWYYLQVSFKWHVINIYCLKKQVDELLKQRDSIHSSFTVTRSVIPSNGSSSSFSNGTNSKATEEFKPESPGEDGSSDGKDKSSKKKWFNLNLKGSDKKSGWMSC